MKEDKLLELADELGEAIQTLQTVADKIKHSQEKEEKPEPTSLRFKDILIHQKFSLRYGHWQRIKVSDNYSVTWDKDNDQLTPCYTSPYTEVIRLD